MKGADYYNEIYMTSSKYNGTYDSIIYYPIYKEIINRINGNDRILELGCGVGHFAEMLKEKGYRNYLGLDFSKVAIAVAKINSGLEFKLCDIMEDDLNYIYDIVVSTEFFEHIEYKKVINKLKKGAEIIFSVPNFLIESHIYSWANHEEIQKDFEKYININKIETILEQGNNKWFLIHGFIK